MWVSGYFFGVKYAHKPVIFFKAGDVIKLAILVYCCVGFFCDSIDMEMIELSTNEMSLPTWCSRNKTPDHIDEIVYY